MPEEELTGFCLWMKNELQPTVTKVSISKRLTSQPAVIFGQMSSSMRMMMQMMDQSQAAEANKNVTLEINPQHPILVKLNRLRKKDQMQATKVVKQLADVVMTQSGIPVNPVESNARNLGLMNNYLKIKVARGRQLVY